MSLRDIAAMETELVELRGALQRSQRAAARAKAKTEDLVAAVYQAARDAAIAQPPIPTAPKVRTRKATKHVALLHTTDWQCGKRTKDFDSEVLGRRLALMCDKVQILADLHANPVDECFVLFGGDMVEGISIFPTQPFEVDSSLYEQLFTVVRYVRMVVDAMLARFQRVTVIEEFGNHGRIGRFGELPEENNLDRVAYTIAAERYADEPRVDWRPWVDEPVTTFAIGAYKAGLLHGDEFARSFSAQMIVSKLTAWQTQHDYDDAYLGHFHRRDSYGMPNGSMAYLTGSPESSNAYAANRLAARGRPSQRLHFVDPERGRVVAEHILWLDE